MPDAIVVMNGKGEIVFFNKHIEKLFGHGMKDLAGQQIEILVPDRFCEAHRIDREEYIHNPSVRPMGKERELYGLHKHDQEIPVEINLGPHEIDGNALVSASIRDISTRKKAEEESRRTNEELLTVNRVLTACASTLNLKEILEISLDEALKIATLEGGTICLIGPGDTLRLVAEKSVSEATLHDLTAHEIKIGECLCGNCAKDLKPLILREYGFTIKEAQDGDDAIQKFRDYKDRIQLIILDVVMPKKSGSEAYKEI